MWLHPFLSQNPRLFLFVALSWPSSLIAQEIEPLAPSTVRVSVGPFFGSGVSSTGDKVRGSMGYAAGIDLPFKVSDKVSIGPRAEMMNTFFSTKGKDAGTQGRTIERTASYDNRIFAGGLTVARSLGDESSGSQGLYLSAVAGRSFSKLAVDEASGTTFDQNLYSGISGSYFAGELGTWIPVRKSFGINLALLGSINRMNQTGARGTRDSQRALPSGGLSLTSRAIDEEDGAIASEVVQKTYAGKLSIVMGF